MKTVVQITHVAKGFNTVICPLSPSRLYFPLNKYKLNKTASYNMQSNSPRLVSPPPRLITLECKSKIK
jgi:hypothetical protein